MRRLYQWMDLAYDLLLLAGLFMFVVFVGALFWHIAWAVRQ